MRGQKKWNLPVIDGIYKQIILNNLALDDYGSKESNAFLSGEGTESAAEKC